MDAESQLVNDWENALKQKSGACVCSLSSTLRGGVLTVACTSLLWRVSQHSAARFRLAMLVYLSLIACEEVI